MAWKSRVSYEKNSSGHATRIFAKKSRNFEIPAVRAGMTKCMHRTMPHSVKYSTALTEITEHTEHVSVCCRMNISTSRVIVNNKIIDEHLTTSVFWVLINNGFKMKKIYHYIHEKKPNKFQNLTNDHQFRYSILLSFRNWYYLIYSVTGLHGDLEKYFNYSFGHLKLRKTGFVENDNNTRYNTC